MTGYGFFAALRGLVAILMLVLAGLAVFVGVIYSEMSTLSRYRQRGGAEWRGAYEKDFGPVSKAHTRIVLSVFGIVTIIGGSAWLCRTMRTDSGQSGRTEKRSPLRRISSAERHALYKRRALVGCFFGVFAILMALLLIIFDWGMFRDHDDEMSLAIFVFIAGYCSVIYGCRWWLKLKAWTEAVLIIGLLPLCILFTPFVRLIFLASPLLLAAMMVIMPIMLVVVVFALPNQSVTSRRRISWRDFDRPKGD